MPEPVGLFCVPSVSFPVRESKEISLIVGYGKVLISQELCSPHISEELKSQFAISHNQDQPMMQVEFNGPSCFCIDGPNQDDGD
jgi:hypothetical protein